jgi:hypothetical protein
MMCPAGRESLLWMFHTILPVSSPLPCASLSHFPLFPSLYKNDLTFSLTYSPGVQGTPGTSRHPATYPYASHGSHGGHFHASPGTPQAQDAARYWWWGMPQSQGTHVPMMHGQASLILVTIPRNSLCISLVACLMFPEILFFVDGGRHQY